MRIRYQIIEPLIEDFIKVIEFMEYINLWVSFDDV